MDLRELGQKAVKLALKSGATEAEALILCRHSIGVDIERAEVKTCSDVNDAGMAIRVITEGKIGFAYTNDLALKNIEKTAEQASKASKASLKDENWKKLPERKSYPTVKRVFDKSFSNFTSDEAVALCLRMMEAAIQVDKRVMPAFGGTEVATHELQCVNSSGLEIQDLGTTMFWGLGAMARSDSNVSPICFEFKASRMNQPEPDWVGKEAARLAIESINVGKAEGGKFPVLLEPFALQSILTYTLIPSIRGDIVYRGRSALKDKIGKEIGGENLTICDDGVLPEGLYTGKADMEGVPRQKTAIIEKGVLCGFIYDNYWAKLVQKESTGNAQRGGGGLNLPPYGTLPAINPSNITVEAGSATEEELLEEVKNGYCVRDVQGAHQSNPETGEFSVAISPAWRVLDGEIVHAVKGVMISGNIYDMIQKISLLGREVRQVGTLVAPKAVISEMNVISK